jgi:antitoxin component YwqK of YwqJK toxin-antitoxin module
MTEYSSSIPDAAEERIVATYADGVTERAEYWLHGNLVGVRWFFETGELQLDYAVRQGRYHGVFYHYDLPGVLLSVTPYVDGLEHGTAYQWDVDGSLLGSYTMEHGTGLGCWWGRRADGTRILLEARYYRDGQRHGFEWWLLEDQQHVYEEGHYANGQPHGILRVWNRHGRLKRGYHQCYIQGERVTKARYVRACRHDPTLPPFRTEDNGPARIFPPDVAQHLGPPL